MSPTSALLVTSLLLATFGVSTSAQTPAERLAAQFPDYRSLPDASPDLKARLEKEGGLSLSPGLYRLGSTLEIDLAKHHGAAIRAPQGGVTLIMDAPGPALRLTGTHQGTADPKSFQPATWNERMPVIEGIEILGADPGADGIELVRVVQPIISQVAVRWCHHAIHLVERNRNIIISECHLFENSGIGIFYDSVNLHQSNISACHISYCREGGVVIRDGNVRNVQISGCDLEGNMPGDATPTAAANILIDVSGTPGDKSHSVAEVSITGCTIQHSGNYSGKTGQPVAPGGANIRFLGKEVYPVDTVSISANVLSDVSVNLDLQYVSDINVAGNVFFAPGPDNILVSHGQRVSLVGNTVNPREFERDGVIRFTDSMDCQLTGGTVHACLAAKGAVELENCAGFLIQGVAFTDCGAGIHLKNTRGTSITGCRISRTLPEGFDLSVADDCEDIEVQANTFTGKVTLPSTSKKEN